MLSHITLAYSNRDLTNVKYIFSRIFRSNINYFFLKIYVQLEASKIVTGGTRLISLNNLYMETGWENLRDRREKHKLVQFYKMTKTIDE
jgi:hypothetical protein